MTITTTKAMTKVAVVAAGLAIAMSMLLAFAPAASAQFSRDLTVGATGADVTTLQQGLIAAGHSIAAGATGYFGMQTKAAVMAWQTSKGIAPAVGYFGPISRTAWGGSMTTGGTTSTVAGCAAGAMFSSTTGAACTTTTTTVAGCAVGALFSSTTGMACGSTTTTTTTTGALTGNGRLTGVGSLGDITSSLKEGDASTAVIGVSADATGGDVSIQRVNVTFNMTGVVGGSSNLNQYVSEVSLWLGSTKLASMDPSLGDKVSSIWTYRFSGINAVIKAGTTGKLYVRVTPLTSIGTLEDGDTITAGLAVDSVRAIGGDGISDTYVGTAISQAFTVSSATTGTLTVTAAGDNPSASQITTSSSTTSGVKVLSFNMKAKNTAVTITDLRVQFSTSDNNVSDVVNTVYLMKGSTVLKSKTASTGTSGFITFTTLNETIAKDVTNNYSLVVDLKNNVDYVDGTTLNASTTATSWDVSDANGAAVTPSAAAVGNTQTLIGTGSITLAVGTATAVKTACALASCGDVGTYAISFIVTAGDADVFIGSAQTRATTPSASAGGASFATTTSSSNVLSPTVSSSFAAANVVTGDVTGAFKVLAGTSRTFTLNVSLTSTSTGFFGVRMTGVNYGPSSTLGTTYYTSNLDTFKTADLQLTKN